MIVYPLTMWLPTHYTSACGVSSAHHFSGRLASSVTSLLFDTNHQWISLDYGRYTVKQG